MRLAEPVFRCCLRVCRLRPRDVKLLDVGESGGPSCSVGDSSAGGGLRIPGYSMSREDGGSGAALTSVRTW